MDIIKKFLNPEVLLKNTYMASLLSIFLAMYGPRLQPKLPSQLRNVFNNDLFRVLVIFLITYMASKNIELAITITVIFLVTLNLLHNDHVIKLLSNEGFSINGTPLSTTNYDKQQTKFTGSENYPLNDNNDLLGMRTDNDYMKYDEMDYDKLSN
uniref:Uncharacterized protein n=1 Tax=viral metagenome TaxID=1070528 RepID=A0A6C0IY42_9ZZZZ